MVRISQTNDMDFCTLGMFIIGMYTVDHKQSIITYM
jgi:hypothetical protein